LLLGGFGLVVYGLAWALLPERRDGRIHAEEMILGRFDIALIGALAFVLVGLGRGDSWFFFWGPPGWIQGLLWLLFVAGIIAVVLVVVNQQPRPARTGYAPGYGQPQYGPPAPAPAPAPGPVWDAAPAPTPTATEAAAPAPTATEATGPASTTTYGAAPAPTYPTAAYGAYPPPPPSTPRHHQRRDGEYPAPAPKPPRPVKPRTPSAGAGTVGVVVSLSLLTLAVLLVGERTGDFDGPVALTALGVAIVLAGLGIIFSGLRGRSSGALGGLAILGLIVAVPVGFATSASTFWQDDSARQFNATDVAATSRAEASDGYSMGFGDVTVDLAAVPLTDDTLVVPISLAAGNLTVVVPSGAAVEADVNLGAGEITWNVDGTTRSQDGVAIDDGSFTTGSDDDAELHLKISVGAGQVEIVDDGVRTVPTLPPTPTLPGLPGEEN
jgi:hypothetical protein